jgi:hypothetical protein
MVDGYGPTFAKATEGRRSAELPAEVASALAPIVHHLWAGGQHEVGGNGFGVVPRAFGLQPGYGVDTDWHGQSRTDMDECTMAEIK